MRDRLLREAESEVIEAARAWARRRPWKDRKPTPEEQRLAEAVFMLGKARTITGSARIHLPPDDSGGDPGDGTAR